MGKRNNEFLKYWDYSILVKDVNDAVRRNDNTTYKVMNTRLYTLKNEIKRLYSFSETDFKIWFDANKEFITILTKQERQNLKDLISALDITGDVAELKAILTALDETNYSEFISEYMEDYAQ